MTFKLIAAPTALAVSLTDAKANLRVDGTDLDTLITAWIKGITAHAENYMQRAIITQAWRAVLDAFPAEIELPRAPVISVTDVKYYDADNVLQTLATSEYVLDNVSEPCRIVPAAGVVWPDTYNRFDAVTVNVSCGYGPDDTTTPETIKLYIMAKLVEQFDPATKPDKDTVQSSFVDSLLDSMRIYR